MNNILVFGEILYDIYDDVAVIGGAPFNYSVQLSRLISKNDNLKFITALGKDDFSKDAFKFIENENIDSSLMQVLDNYETGKPITKSGLNHRFRKVRELANKMKEGSNNENIPSQYNSEFFHAPLKEWILSYAHGIHHRTGLIPVHRSTYRQDLLPLSPDHIQRSPS